MSKIIIASLLIYSSIASAKTSATSALNNLIKNGSYSGHSQGLHCEVRVQTKQDLASVEIITSGQSEFFSLLDSSLSYHVDEKTGELSATMNLAFPHYINGATKLLSVRSVSANEVAVSISMIALDHRGNDMSTFSNCKITTK